MVTSLKHIKELDRAPRHVLSLHAVAKEVSSVLTSGILHLLTLQIVPSTEAYNARF